MALAHNQRTVTVSNADPARRDRNIDLLAHDERTPMQRWDQRMAACGNPPIRTNAVVAIEMFYGYSPEATWIDPLEWAKACAAFEEKHFGKENIVSLTLHGDEKTPHVHAVSVPIIRKPIRGKEPEDRLCASHWLDGPVKLRRLQTDFWEDVGKRFCLERGESGSSRKHKTQKEMYQISNEIETVVTDAVDSIPAIKPAETENAHHKSIQDHLTRHLAELAEAAKQGALTQMANRAAAAANLKREEEYRLRKKAEEDRDRALREAERVRREHQDRMRDLPVSSVLRSVMGIQPMKEGNQWVFETPAIKVVVHADDRRFSVFKVDKRGGSGAISAVMQVADCNFVEAVRWLAAHYSPTQVETVVRIAYEGTIKKTASEAAANPITLAEKLKKYASIVEANWASVREYLVRDRCLPATWVDGLHRRGRIWSNEHRSACFGHRDLAGSIVGVSVRSTTSRFFQTIGDKDAGFFSLRLSPKTSRQIAIVESPIEAISLASLNRDLDTMYASTAGAGGLKPVLELAQKFRLGILAAQNDDAAGEVQAALTADICLAHNLSCTRVRPPMKDWNDTLKYLHHEMRLILKNGDLITKRLRGVWRSKMHVIQPSQTTKDTILLLPEPTTTQDSSPTL